MPIHVRYGDKNGVLSQRLDISPVTPKAMLYWQASYTAIVAVFGVLVLCGSINNVRPCPMPGLESCHKSENTKK